LFLLPTLLFVNYSVYLPSSLPGPVTYVLSRPYPARIHGEKVLLDSSPCRLSPVACLCHTRLNFNLESVSCAPFLQCSVPISTAPVPDVSLQHLIHVAGSDTSKPPVTVADESRPIPAISGPLITSSFKCTPGHPHQPYLSAPLQETTLPSFRGSEKAVHDACTSRTNEGGIQMRSNDV